MRVHHDAREAAGAVLRPIWWLLSDRVHHTHLQCATDAIALLRAAVKLHRLRLRLRWPVPDGGPVLAQADRPLTVVLAAENVAIIVFVTLATVLRLKVEAVGMEEFAALPTGPNCIPEIVLRHLKRTAQAHLPLLRLAARGWCRRGRARRAIMTASRGCLLQLRAAGLLGIAPPALGLALKHALLALQCLLALLELLHLALLLLHLARKRCFDLRLLGPLPHTFISAFGDNLFAIACVDVSLIIPPATASAAAALRATPALVDHWRRHLALARAFAFAFALALALALAHDRRLRLLLERLTRVVLLVPFVELTIELAREALLKLAIC
mmetsp:Transcript_13065/g.40757  ORF Transcript_13065/g.40757 Transcript_13065/m.40757 type:complete len:327 (-) Transcript_13065:1806-2786(-)